MEREGRAGREVAAEDGEGGLATCSACAQKRQRSMWYWKHRSCSRFTGTPDAPPSGSTWPVLSVRGPSVSYTRKHAG